MQPLQGQAFIGRHHALDALDRWGREANAGEPRLVVITGASGVGKSRLLNRYLDRHRHDAAAPMLGACHQGATIPYLPVVSALRPLFGHASVASGPERPLRDALTAAPRRGGDPTDADGESRRLELFLSAAGAVTDAARVGPVLLALEDLQWADQPSLELLAHVVSTVAQEGSVGPLRALIVLTRRDSPMPDAGEQLMARLAREEIYRELPLTGLTELETNLLLASILGARPAGQLLLAMQEATDGNPLFVGSLCRRLAEADQLFLVDGVVSAATDELVGLPTDLDAALADVIGALTEPGRHLAERAAFLGDEGTLADLAAVSEMDEDALTRARHELELAGVLVPGGPGFRFGHGQIRQLLHQAPVPRRAELHRLIADRLEASAADPGQAAMGIAYHLRRAGPGVDRARLMAAATLAGDTAFSVGAWAKAARELTSALEAAEAGGLLDDGERAELEERAGTAYFRDHDLAEARRHAETAVALARTTGDIERWGSALSLAMRIRFAHGASTVGRAVDAGPIQEFLAEAGDREPALRARLLGELAEMSFAAFDVGTGRELAVQALALAESVGDHQLLADIHFALGLAHLGAIELAEARASFDVSVEHARALADPWQLAWGLGRLPLVSLAQGQLDRTDTETAEQVELTGRSRDWAELSLATALRAATESARGRFAEVEARAAETELLYARSRFAFTPAVVYPALAMARAHRGDDRGGREALERWRDESGASTWRYQLAVDLAAGHTDRARRSLAERPYTPTRRPLTFFNADGVSVDVEVAALCGDADLAAECLDKLTELTEHHLVVLPGSGAFVGRLMGQALAAAGRRSEAVEVLGRAQHDAATLGLGPEQARAGLELARALAGGQAPGVDQAGRGRLEATVREAIADADRLGMLPLLAAGQALVAELGPAAAANGWPVGPAPRTRVILVSDLVGSTELNVRAGDAAWVDLLGHHDQIVRSCLRRHGGVEFKHTGDGMCAWFESGPGALDCADEIRQALAEVGAGDPDLALVARFGLACGQPIGVGDDLFGLAVTLAARLCAAATPGGILASEEAMSAGLGSSVELEADGQRALKGFPGPVPVYASIGPHPTSRT